MRCWYTRWQMSNALDRGELAAFLSRGHAAGCAACQLFARSLTSLDARLAADAHLAVTPAIPVLRARRTRWPLWLAAPALAGAAVVVVIASSGGEPPVVRPADAPHVLQVSDALVRARGVADQVSQALARTPLETELDHLIHDGKRGLDAMIDTTGLR